MTTTTEHGHPEPPAEADRTAPIPAVRLDEVAGTEHDRPTDTDRADDADRPTEHDRTGQAGAGRTWLPAAERDPASTARAVPRPVSRLTAEDLVMQVGSLLASVALTWLLYTQVLPFDGVVGFVLCLFVVYVGVYALVTSVTQPGPIVVDRVVSAVVTLGALVVVAAVLWAIVYTVYRAAPVIKFSSFYTQDMSKAGPLSPLSQGGISHALVGTAIELGLAVLVSLPLGVATAVYLSEVGGRFARLVRTIVEAMTALPDLIAGLFIYAFLMVALGQQRTGYAAALALGITMLPIIARSAEVVLRIVPGGLREASLALGASQWRTVWTVVLPTAKAGLASALILGMARGIGESAPLIIVAGNSNYFNVNPFSDPMNSLPLFAYNGIRASDESSITRGYGAAFVLLVFVTVLFIAVRLLARRKASR